MNVSTNISSKPEKSVDTLTQWQLIQIRFSKHRFARYSLYLLIILYFAAAFAEFFATYSSGWRNQNFIYSPPQIPRVSLEYGLHVPRYELVRDTITLKRDYILIADDPVLLSLFAKGEPYKLLGFIPMDRHFIGVSNPEDVFYLFGGDRFGRDIYSRLLYGGRISLSIGIVSIITTFFLGVIIGGISGYAGGRTDLLIQRFIEIINSIPQLPIWLAMAAVMPGDWPPLNTYFMITIVLSLVGWTGLARIVRGKILSLREEDFAVAARLLGASHKRIIFRHLLPGFTSHIIVSLTLTVPAMILGETALSFLGLGLRPPVVSWGVMLQDCMNFDVVANYPWLLMPVLMIVLTVLAFNFLGDGLRDAADPYGGK